MKAVERPIERDGWVDALPAMFQLIGDAVSITDVDSERLLFGNEAFYALFRPGATRDANEAGWAVAASDVEAFRGQIGSTEVLERFISVTGAAGEPRHVRVRSFPLYDAGGRLRWRGWVAEDRTDERAMAAQGEARRKRAARQIRRERLLTHVRQQAISDSDVDPLLDEGVALVAAELDKSRCALYELVASTGELHARAAVGFDSLPTPFAAAGSFAGRALETDDVVRLEDEPGPRPGPAEVANAAGAIAFAVRSRNWVGVLVAYGSEPREADADELAFVRGVGFILGSAIGRRAAEQETEELSRLRGRLVSEVLAAEERTHKAVCESIHDHALQNLLAAQQDLATETPSACELEHAREAVAATVSDLRELIVDLHPAVARESSLREQLMAVTNRLRPDGSLDLVLEPEPEVEDGPHAELFAAVARELLSNAIRHGDARSVQIKLDRAGADHILEVRDDGRGLRHTRLEEALAQGHIGLATTRERVSAAGGRMSIAGCETGGTAIRIVVPTSPREDDPRGLDDRRESIER